ncbi:dihydroneopterin aldolase [Parerythrobacter jejuensis]|uniref:FolB domain-containing protein n=1 Tax=Parerythrobacter jejuensis TaxID=795812 RepID=A0A845ANH9_9SPHN|nr:dihydroneopterin aldolase [Parerythrobacter jejuensis]MXP31840.1 FolB domain-containing protein [Parerythrobacter jejuensis]
MADSLTLQFADLETDVLTGIYSEETGKPQPLRITIEADYKIADRYDPDTPLDASKNYMDLKFAATDGLPEGVHFKLIESLADHICETLFAQDRNVLAVTVKIVKLAIAEHNEKIGITMRRERR